MIVINSFINVVVFWKVVSSQAGILIEYYQYQVKFNQLPVLYMCS